MKTTNNIDKISDLFVNQYYDPSKNNLNVLFEKFLD